MVSRTLIKLIDQAIVPAVVLLAVKVVSVVAISSFLKINFAVHRNGFVFSSKADYILVNSYSTLAMITVIAVGVLFVLIKAFYFHDSHISPLLTSRVFNLRLSTLIQNSFELYSQGTVWLSYLLLITIVSGILMAMGLIYSWIFYTGLIISVVGIVMLIVDIENEMEIRSGKAEYLEDDSPVEIYTGNKNAA